MVHNVPDSRGLQLHVVERLISAQGPESFALLPNDDAPSELRIVCTNFECDFTRDRALPIAAVDEPLYRRLPAFLIAWFPAVENRGEGVFLQIRAEAVKKWLGRPKVAQRLEGPATGHKLWMEDRKAKRLFPGGPYGR